MDKKPKEYWGKTLDDLGISIDQFNEVADKYELNLCDKCGVIESSHDLIWLEYDDNVTEGEWKIISGDGEYIALCQLCIDDKRKKVICS